MSLKYDRDKWETKDNQFSLTRRHFLQTGLAVAGGIVISCGSCENIKSPFVNTVTGRITLDKMGFTLPHEHVMVDWNGGDGKSRERYDPVEVVHIMLPYLQEIKDFGVKTFVDCTPPFLGRDINVLSDLSKATGLNIITNTGLYEKTYAPPFAFKASIEEIAEMFIKEIRDGIEGTEIKAGFIKIGVSNEGPVTPNDEKIVTAACRANKLTGATINSHTFQGISALKQLDILEHEKVNPSIFTYVHAGFEPDIKYNIEAANRGAWIEYDNIREETRDTLLERIGIMLDKGFEDRILLSQDRGWYRVGEEHGGTINAYSYLPKVFLPLMEEKGYGKELIHKLTVVNPARSFAMQE